MSSLSRRIKTLENALGILRKNIKQLETDVGTLTYRRADTKEEAAKIGARICKKGNRFDNLLKESTSIHDSLKYIREHEVLSHKTLGLFKHDDTPKVERLLTQANDLLGRVRDLGRWVFTEPESHSAVSRGPR